MHPTVPASKRRKRRAPAAQLFAPHILTPKFGFTRNPRRKLGGAPAPGAAFRALAANCGTPKKSESPKHGNITSGAPPSRRLTPSNRQGCAYFPQFMFIHPNSAAGPRKIHRNAAGARRLRRFSVQRPAPFVRTQPCLRRSGVNAAPLLRNRLFPAFSLRSLGSQNGEPEARARITLTNFPRPEPPRRRSDVNCLVPPQFGTQPRPGMNSRLPSLVLQPAPSRATASTNRRKNFMRAR